jgi:hypothetical protein
LFVRQDAGDQLCLKIGILRFASQNFFSAAPRDSPSALACSSRVT